jgi:hypothetical protein
MRGAMPFLWSRRGWSTCGSLKQTDAFEEGLDTFLDPSRAIPPSPNAYEELRAADDN